MGRTILIMRPLFYSIFVSYCQKKSGGGGGINFFHRRQFKKFSSYTQTKTKPKNAKKIKKLILNFFCNLGSILQ